MATRNRFAFQYLAFTLLPIAVGAGIIAVLGGLVFCVVLDRTNRP